MAGKTGDDLVRGFSLENLEIPQEQEELNDDESRTCDEPSALGVDFDEEPDDEDRGDEEENGAHDGVDSLQSPGADVEEVQDEQDDVNDDTDEVESRRESEATLSEAGTSSVPLRAEKRADDESDDDLENLDDSAVGGKVAGVQRNLAHSESRKC